MAADLKEHFNTKIEWGQKAKSGLLPFFIQSMT